jgi:hypothetical protein
MTAEYLTPSMRIALTARIRTFYFRFPGYRPFSTQQRPVIYIGQDWFVL